MVRRSARNQFLSTCLVALAVGCSQQSPDQSQVAEAAAAKAKQADEPKPTVTQDDLQILDVVLVDLLDFKEFDPARGVRKGRTEILLDPTSAGPSVYLSDDVLQVETLHHPEHTIPSGLSDDLRKRNTRGDIPLTAFKPSDPRIVIRDLSELTGMGGAGCFLVKTPHAIGYVGAWLPGYAKDGQTAVFHAWFGPTAHGSYLTYLLAKKEGQWTVVWRKTIDYR